MRGNAWPPTGGSAQTRQTRFCTLTTAMCSARAVSIEISLGGDRFLSGGNLDEVGIVHPGRKAALAMQHSPDVNVVWALEVERQMRITRRRPGAQAW